MGINVNPKNEYSTLDTMLRNPLPYIRNLTKTITSNPPIPASAY